MSIVKMAYYILCIILIVFVFKSRKRTVIAFCILYTCIYVYHSFLHLLRHALKLSLARTLF